MSPSFPPPHHHTLSLPPALRLWWMPCSLSCPALLWTSVPSTQNSSHLLASPTQLECSAQTSLPLWQSLWTRRLSISNDSADYVVLSVSVFSTRVWAPWLLPWLLPHTALSLWEQKKGRSSEGSKQHLPLVERLPCCTLHLLDLAFYIYFLTQSTFTVIPRLIFCNIRLIKLHPWLYPFSQAAITTLHRLCGLSNRNLFFSQFWRLRSLWPKCHQRWFLGRALFPACRQHLLTMSSHGLSSVQTQERSFLCLFLF